MARSKSIVSDVGTEHHGAMSPSWVHYGRINCDFDDAAAKLAEWDPQLGHWDRDSWVRHPDSPFFWCRDRLIDCAIRWQLYDWSREEAAREYLLAKARKTKAADQELSAAILNLESIHLLEESKLRDLKALRDSVRKWPDTPIWTDLIEWRELRQKFPNKNCIVGMMLADTLLRWRDRKNNPPSIHSPYRLQILQTQIILPWEALALFADAATGETTDSKNLRSKVLNIWPNIERYYLPPAV